MKRMLNATTAISKPATVAQAAKVTQRNLKAATRAARQAEKTASAALRATSAVTAAVAPRESRVRPRAAAWAAGTWLRAEHPLQAMPGRSIRQLAYGLYLPANGETKDMPLVVMLHGCTQDADQFAQGTRMNLLADRHGFAVLYPEQSLQSHAHGCWNWYDDSERGGRGEAQAVAELVDALVAQYGFDAARVYVAGMSAGAGLTSLLALHHPDRFAAVALHSGPAFGDARSGIGALDVMRRGLLRQPVAVVDAIVKPRTYPGMPALIIHGAGDAVVAPVNGEQLAVEFSRLDGLLTGRGRLAHGVTRDETAGEGMRVVDYRKDGRTVVRLCVVDGLAHAWSGGDDAVPFHSAAGPDASETMWSFFNTCERPVIAS